MNVRLNLKKIRLDKGLTQEQVSRGIDIPNSTYRYVESDRGTNVNYVILFKLRDYFGFGSVDELFIFGDSNN